MYKIYQTVVAAILALSSISAQAAAPLQTITVTDMLFYDATGVLNAAGTNTTVNGVMNSDVTGVIDSGGTLFVGSPWTADQVMWDGTPGAGKIWTGTSAQGFYSYTYNLTENQVAVGMLFTWSFAVDIAVLQIFDCGPNAGDACVGVHDDPTDNATPADHTDINGIDDHTWVPGSAMGNGPFTNQHAVFFGVAATVIDATPVANDDTVGTIVDTPLIIDVVANDADWEDGSLPIPVGPAVVNAPGTSAGQGFTLTDNLDGTITYTPTGGYLGGDSFTYTVTDSFGNTSAAATVNITVSAAPNAAPVVTSPNLNTDEDTHLVIDMATLATDGDGDSMTFAAFDAVTTKGGTVTANGANNKLTYTPKADDNSLSGDDTFTYQVTDTVDSSGVGTVTISVNSINDDPVCLDIDLATDSNTPLIIDETADLIDAACSDVDVDALSVASTTQPVNGSVASDGAGTLTYTPNADYSGDDSFDVTVSDGQGGEVTATVTVTVGILYGNFTMLDVSGEVFGGTNDVIFVWDGVTVNIDEADNNFGIMTIESKGPEPFFGAPWVAHHVRVFGPGTYSFDSTCTTAQLDAGTTACNNLPWDPGQTEQFATMTVGAGQYGAHILFDWSGSEDIDVVVVWDVNGVWEDADGQSVLDPPESPKNDLELGGGGTPPDPLTIWELVSRDVNGDGVNGSPMVDGPFIGYYSNFSDGPAGSGAAKLPITGTASDTRLGGGALGLVSLLGLLSIVILFRRRIRH